MMTTPLQFVASASAPGSPSNSVGRSAEGLRIAPLVVIVLAHVALLFWLMHGRPVQISAPAAAPKEVIATLIRPETPVTPKVAPTLAPPPEPPKPAPRPAVRKTVAPALPKAEKAPAPVAERTPQVTAPTAEPTPPPISPLPPKQTQAAPQNPPAAAPAPAPAPVASAEPKTVTSGVQYLQPPQPDYPIAAKRLGEEGKVTLRVLVNAQGRPESAEVRQSSGSSRLDEAAREAVMRARFRPNLDNGVPVAVFAIVPITFQLDR